jgi:hypothetical protein
MKCPYCVSEIAREALVCPVCRRDLYLFKPLLARIAELEQALEESRAGVVPASATAEASPAGTVAPPVVPAPVVPPSRGWLYFWGLPLVLLLVAHGLIVVTFDLNTLYLRIVSLLIPLPFGYLWLRQRPDALAGGALAAFLMAALAVLGMSGVVAWVDGVSWLPQGRGEWREFAEYAASVGFSYLTGMLLGRLKARSGDLVRNGGWKMALARRMVSGQPTMEKLQAAVSRINEVSSSLVAIGTTVISIYTGLKDLLG